MGTPVELFISGLVLGAGPCSLFCLPILIPYVASTSEGLVNAVKATLTFSISRLSAYTLLGFVAGYSGEQLVSILGQTEFGLYIWIAGGFFIFILGVLILLGREPKVTVERFLMKYTLDNSLKSIGFIGFIVGITPCAPLMGILSYIALSAKAPLMGAFYALCFGLGASVITPITALGIVAGVAPRLIFKTTRIYRFFKRSCGIILLLLGVRLMVSHIIGIPQYW